MTTTYLEIYITDTENKLQSFWRRALHDLPPVVGMKYLLRSRDGAQQWPFPSGGVESGEHYDTSSEVYVVWVRMTEPASFEHFNFSRLERTR